MPVRPSIHYSACPCPALCCPIPHAAIQPERRQTQGHHQLTLALAPPLAGLQLHLQRRPQRAAPDRELPPAAPAHKDPRARLHAALPQPAPARQRVARRRVRELRHPRRGARPLPRKHLLPQLRAAGLRRPPARLRHLVRQRLPDQDQAHRRRQDRHQGCHEPGPRPAVRHPRRPGLASEPGAFAAVFHYRQFIKGEGKEDEEG